MSAGEHVIDQLLSAYQAHDVEALRRLYAEEAVLRVGDLEFRGRERIAGFWSSWFEAFPDASSVIEQTTGEADRAVLRWVERGTHLRPLRMGGFKLPAHGRSLCWRGVSIYEVAGGEIARVDYFVDRLALIEQLVKPVALSLALWRRLGGRGAGHERGRGHAPHPSH